MEGDVPAVKDLVIDLRPETADDVGSACWAGLGPRGSGAERSVSCCWCRPCAPVAEPGSHGADSGKTGLRCWCPPRSGTMKAAGATLTPRRLPLPASPAGLSLPLLWAVGSWARVQTPEPCPA